MMKKVFGRQEIIDIAGKKCTLVLVKITCRDQSGDRHDRFTAPLSVLTCCILLNANYATRNRR